MSDGMKKHGGVNVCTMLGVCRLESKYGCSDEGGECGEEDMSGLVNSDGYMQ